MDETNSLCHGPHMNILPPTPAGLESLYTLCRKLYPDQANPLQVTALLKLWLGGPDPLDYISMYSNPGIPHEGIAPHWHYISFGLSDLHGDARVHDVSSPEGVSGFGFELTFRLKKEPEETAPPTWPATLMQSLAKYVFRTGNVLCAGDHVSWHCALDNSESRVQHMLMTSDMQLQSARTPFGSVDFIQIVGICAEELKAAQQWNGSGILEILRRIPPAGGPWHVTDMRRGESLFELDLNVQEEVERGFELEGSNLSGVSARCSWTEERPSSAAREKTDCEGGAINDGNTRQSISHQQKNFANNNLQLEKTSATMFRLEKMKYSSGISESTELMHVKKLEGVNLFFNLEAGSLLPLAIRGRVKHGRHFTFKSVLGDTAITLVATSVTGTLVNNETPYSAQGSWLQVLIPDELAQDMAVSFQVLLTPEMLSLPKTFSWPDRKLSITIVEDKV